MKEADYIRATNLVKLRIARQILGDVMMESILDAKKLSEIRAVLQSWITHLDKSVIRE